MQTIYLDNNATTRPAPEVVEAVTRALAEDWPNPSSVHRPGQAARRRIELARHAVCELLGCGDRELIFTAGGTEADNLAVLGSLEAQPRRNVVVSSRLEHSAVRETVERAEQQGAEAVWLESDGDGLIRLDALRDVLAERAEAIALVTLMWVNNETGVIQPIETIGALCREHGVRFHTDAVQWVGKMPIDAAKLPVDLLSFSAHKFHGPKGVGGLYVRRGVRVAPRSIGGPQERDRRGGTENTPGIMGLAAAATVARAWLATDGRDRAAALRDAFERGVRERVAEARVIGSGAPRIWSTSNIAFRRLEAEAVLLLLSERGVCASAGAACSSGSLDPSPVLLAMGVPPADAHGAVRFSLGRDTTDEEIERAIEVIAATIDRLRTSLSAV